LKTLPKIFLTSDPPLCYYINMRNKLKSRKEYFRSKRQFIKFLRLLDAGEIKKEDFFRWLKNTDPLRVPNRVNP
jgi:hypothetical protein